MKAKTLVARVAWLLTSLVTTSGSVTADGVQILYIPSRPEAVKLEPNQAPILLQGFCTDYKNHLPKPEHRKSCLSSRRTSRSRGQIGAGRSRLSRLVRARTGAGGVRRGAGRRNDIHMYID
jgi:hypothetical protein